MEVGDKPAAPGPNLVAMRDYWPRYRRRTYIIVTATQVAFMLVFFGVLELLQIVQLGVIGFFAIAFIAAAILNIFTIALIHVIGKPFRDLVQAIVLTAGGKTISTPPNPNQPEYEKDGFHDILQFVYELAANEDRQQDIPPITHNQVLTTALSHVSTGIVIMNQRRDIIYSNNAAPVRIDENGRNVLELLFPEDNTLTAWLDKADKTKVTAEHQWLRIANRLPGDQKRQIFDVAVSYRKGNEAETVITLFNRTDDYMPEEDELDFISFAAHELRGPITVIRGYLDVLHEELKPTLQQDQNELIERLIVTSNRLTSYVNNILNASRYDRRHLRLHLSEEKIRTVYDAIADDMQLRASAQNRILVADIPDSLPTVAVDVAAAGEVLGNLIDNAVKYSNEGGLVHVVARAIPGFIEVSVIDRGIGMPSSVLPNLFHKFYRSHRSRETVAGTGIGLYISKAIVASHGGTITARSTENEGSTFSFTLPIYDTVAEKLKSSNNSNQSLIEHGSGWIKNHSLYRG